MPRPPSATLTRRRRRKASAKAIGLAVSMIVAFGCVGSTPSSPGPLLPKPLASCDASRSVTPPDSFRAEVMRRPGADLVLEVSRTVPGGLTSFIAYASGGALLQMVDTTYADTVLAALAAAAPVSSRAREGLRPANLEVRQVAYSRVDLDAWRAYIWPLLATETVSSVGTDWLRARVAVTVPTEADRTRVETRLARAALPCGLVQTQIGGTVVGRSPGT